MGLWAVVPVKELDRAKERLGPVLPPRLRQSLMLAMLEDVLESLNAGVVIESLRTTSEFFGHDASYLRQSSGLAEVENLCANALSIAMWPSGNSRL